MTTSWEEAYELWKEHQKSFCMSDESQLTDICQHVFPFGCVECGKQLVPIGEALPDYEMTGGKCEKCFYELEVNSDAF